MNYRTLIKFFISFSFIIFANISTTLAEFTVATVDVNKILNESKDAAQKKKALDSQSSKARKTIESRRSKLQKLEKELKEKNLSEDSSEVQEFRKEAKEFARLVKDTEEELKGKFLQMNRSLTQNAMNIITKYAKSNDIDLVIDSSRAPRGPVLYGKPSLDITDSVIKKING